MPAGPAQRPQWWKGTRAIRINSGSELIRPAVSSARGPAHRPPLRPARASPTRFTACTRSTVTAASKGPQTPPPPPPRIWGVRVSPPPPPPPPDPPPPHPPPPPPPLSYSPP